MERVELLPDGLDHPAIVVTDGNGVNAGNRVVIALPRHVPVIDAVGPLHDEWLPTPLGHLIADENLPQKLLLRGLRRGRQVGGHGGRLEIVTDALAVVARGECIQNDDIRRLAQRLGGTVGHREHDRILMMAPESKNHVLRDTGNE